MLRHHKSHCRGLKHVIKRMRVSYNMNFGYYTGGAQEWDKELIFVEQLIK